MDSINKKYTSLQIIMMGWVIVYIPCTLVILALWYIFWAYFQLDYTLAAIIGTIGGWIYWEFAIRRWIKWAFSVGTEKDKILFLGRLGLLLWNKSTVDKALLKK